MLAATTGKAQSIAIEVGHPEAYPGLDNRLTVIAEGVDCRNMYVTVDNGLVSKGDSSCQFLYNVQLAGVAHLSVYTISGGDTSFIASRKIVIRRWPEQFAFYGDKQRGAMSLGEFLAHGRVSSPINAFDISGNNPIESYEILLIRGNSLLFKELNRGGQITDQNLKRLVEIKDGDLIRFKNIYARIVGDPDPRKLNDIEIEIIN